MLSTLRVSRRVENKVCVTYGLASESLDEDLHATTETENKMEGRFLLDVVVGQGATIFKLLASKDQALLIRRNALLVCDGLELSATRPSEQHTLNLALDVVDGIGRLNPKKVSGNCAEV